MKISGKFKGKAAIYKNFIDFSYEKNPLDSEEFQNFSDYGFFEVELIYKSKYFIIIILIFFSSSIILENGNFAVYLYEKCGTVVSLSSPTDHNWKDISSLTVSIRSDSNEKIRRPIAYYDCPITFEV